jgi:hypothetical protein
MSNPFAGADIMVPEEYREHLDAFVQRKEGKAAQPVHQPFGRNIDMWFFAVCLAVKKGLSPAASTGKMYKAAEGVVLNSDPWRPTALTLLAIGETNDVSIVDPGTCCALRMAMRLPAFPSF